MREAMTNQNTDFKQNLDQEANNDVKRTYRILGPLETQLMEAVWDSLSPLSVQEIIDRLDTAHNYKTVMTVLNRLVDKQLLGRRLDGRAYRYYSIESKPDFLRSVAESLVNDYVNLYGASAADLLASAIERTQSLGKTNEQLSTSQNFETEIKYLQRYPFLVIVFAALSLEIISSIFRPRKKR